MMRPEQMGTQKYAPGQYGKNEDGCITYHLNSRRNGGAEDTQKLTRGVLMCCEKNFGVRAKTKEKK